MSGGRRPVRCSCPILWVVVSKKDGGTSRMPLDPNPTPLGSVAAYKDASGRIVARVLGKGDAPGSHEKLYMPHAATCQIKRAADERARQEKAARGRHPVNAQRAETLLDGDSSGAAAVLAGVAELDAYRRRRRGRR